MTDVRARRRSGRGRPPALARGGRGRGDAGPSPAKLIAAVVIGLIAIGLIVGGLFWLGNRDSRRRRSEELIASPGRLQGAARPRPAACSVDNSATTQVATSEGTEQTASINPMRAPEAPVNQPAQQQHAAGPARQPQAQRRPAGAGSRRPAAAGTAAAAARRARPSRSAPIRAKRRRAANGRG